MIASVILTELFPNAFGKSVFVVVTVPGSGRKKDDSFNSRLFRRLKHIECTIYIETPVIYLRFLSTVNTMPGGEVQNQITSLCCPFQSEPVLNITLNKR